MSQTPQENIPQSQPRRFGSPGAITLLLLICAPLALAGNFTVTTKQRDARPLAGAVVTLEPETANAAPAPPITAIMDQVDLAFAPDVLVIPVHSTVQFPNSDAVSHQVYSFSGAKSFQLPLYRGKPYPPVEFDQPGVVTLGCNIHDNMVAYILVTRAAYYGRTGADGKWTTRGLPPGRYLLRVWHPQINEGREVSREITAGGADGATDVQLTRSLRPAPLTGRPHSWDY